MKRRIITPYSVQSQQRRIGLIGSCNLRLCFELYKSLAIRTSRKWSNAVMAGLLATGLSVVVTPNAAAQTAEPTDRFRILSGPIPGGPGTPAAGGSAAPTAGGSGTPTAGGQATPAAIWLMLDSQTGKTWQLACGVGAASPASPAAPPTSSFGSPAPCVLEWFPLAHSPRTPPARTPP
jgi:hypothetical protein